MGNGQGLGGVIMRTVYLDENYICHVENAEGRTAYEVDFLDNACDLKIESTRYVPGGHRWIRSDGIIFPGPMVAYTMDSQMVDAAQREYEQAQAEIEDMKTALNELGVKADG